MVSDLSQAPSLTDFIASQQWGTLGVLTKEVQQPNTTLLEEYVVEGILLHARPDWSQKDLEKLISLGNHVSACTPNMIAFILGDVSQRMRDGFNIFILAIDAFQMFRERINMSRTAAVPQEHRGSCLILSLSGKPYDGTTSVYDTT